MTRTCYTNKNVRRSGLLILACLFIASACDGAEGRVWTRSFLTKKAPELIVEKWLTKEPDRTGKFVLIDFWSTSCDFCRADSQVAIPKLNALHKKYSNRLVVIGLSDEKEDKVRSIKKPKIEYFSAIDTQRRTATTVGIVGMPHVMFIDPEGIVRWQGFPLLEGNDITEQVVKEWLEKQHAR